MIPIYILWLCSVQWYTASLEILLDCLGGVGFDETIMKNLCFFYYSLPLNRIKVDLDALLFLMIF